MSGLLITSRTLRDRRVSLTWWSIGLVFYTGFIMAVWPVIDDNEDFQDLADNYPEAIQAMMGGADAFSQFTTPAGFLNSYLFAMILPLLLVGLAVSMGSALIAGEEETGLLDLLLSNPVTRSRVVTEKSLGIVAALALLGFLLVVVVLGLGQVVDLHVGISGLIAATVGSMLFGLFHGVVAMLAGSIRGPKGFATGLAWGVAMVGYLMYVVSNMDASLDFLRWFSPLGYATADDPINNGLPIEYVALVAGVAAVFAATVVMFRRHDLS